MYHQKNTNNNNNNDNNNKKSLSQQFLEDPERIKSYAYLQRLMSYKSPEKYTMYSGGSGNITNCTSSGCAQTFSCSTGQSTPY